MLQGSNSYHCHCQITGLDHAFSFFLFGQSEYTYLNGSPLCKPFNQHSPSQVRRKLFSCGLALLRPFSLNLELPWSIKLDMGNSVIYK